MRRENCSGGIAARANGLLLLFRFGLFRLFRLFCFLSHSVHVLFVCGAAALEKPGCAPMQYENRLIRLGLSAKEPMILVDKRLEKATAPHLLWVTSDRVEPVAGPAMSASLIGRSESSTFRLSAAAVSMSLTGFSNRPFRVKHFQTIRRCSVDVAHGLALLFGIGAKALPLWDSRMRWSNLCSGLAVRRNGRSKRTCELTSSIVPRGTSFHRWVDSRVTSYRV